MMNNELAGAMPEVFRYAQINTSIINNIKPMYGLSDVDIKMLWIDCIIENKSWAKVADKRGIARENIRRVISKVFRMYTQEYYKIQKQK